MIGLMLSQRSVSELSKDDRKAFDEFSEMFKQIAEAKGEYRMVGQKVIVTVTDKHWLLPWPVVEAQLRELVL